MFALDCILNLREILDKYFLMLLMHMSVTAALDFKVFNNFGITTVMEFFEIISIPAEELFSEMYVGCTASYFVLII